MTYLKDWWNNRTPFMKFMYGLLAGLIIVFIITSVRGQQQGLRIDKNYIKSVSGQEAYVNDVYVTSMINFVDYCGSTTTLHRFNDFQGRVYGITLWCRNNSKSFTFFYSDEWRIKQYGKFEELKT